MIALYIILLSLSTLNVVLDDCFIYNIIVIINTKYFVR
jgi:hypothetical protein